MSRAYSFKWNKSILKNLDDSVVARMKGCALKTSNKAKEGAPVLSGTLQNSIRIVDIDRTTEVLAAGGEMEGSKVLYAWLREYKNKANPDKRHYMRKAFKWLKKNYKKEFKGLTK